MANDKVELSHRECGIILNALFTCIYYLENTKVRLESFDDVKERINDIKSVQDKVNVMFKEKINETA